MKSQHINPFIEATISTFETMCGLKPFRSGKLQVRGGMIFTYDFIGILGLSGQIRGAVIMTMPIPVGMRIVSEFVGETITDTNSDLMDGFGEILNIIAGAAAAKIHDYKISLALPTVMIGKDQQMHANQHKPWVIIPMSFPDDIGNFNIEVAMKET